VSDTLSGDIRRIDYPYRTVRAVDRVGTSCGTLLLGFWLLPRLLDPEEPFLSPFSRSTHTIIRNGGRRRTAALTALTMLCALVVATVAGAPSASAATPVQLGSAETFAVLAGTTVTNTGPTVISGDLGVSPGSAVTGFPPGTVIDGTIHAADATAAQAQVDLTAAYNEAALRTTEFTISSDLGGQTLTPGVYTAPAGIGLTGTVILDGQNDPNAVFVFQAGSTLVTASNSTVQLVNVNPCNVFWQVGSSATLGTGSTFAGSILALTSITVTTGVTITGQALARNGAVTLDTNVITRSVCTDDFSMTAIPSSDTARAGGTVTSEIDTTVIDGFATAVTLSASGLPPGATISFLPTSMNTGEFALMRINTTSATPPGTYTITITATDGTTTRTTTYQFTVTASGEVIPIGHPETGAGGTAAGSGPWRGR
jgi:hypothetical protein